jgi:hypothetical protein
MPFGKEQFRVLPEHVTLLSNARVSWDSGEFGAPAVDCKRPYGNSYVEGDLMALLNVAPDHPNRPAGDYDPNDCDVYAMYTDQTIDRVIDLHKQTETVLQIFLNTGAMLPGLYEREQYVGRWARIAD